MTDESGIWRADLHHLHRKDVSITMAIEPTTKASAIRAIEDSKTTDIKTIDAQGFKVSNSETINSFAAMTIIAKIKRDQHRVRTIADQTCEDLTQAVHSNHKPQLPVVNPDRIDNQYNNLQQKCPHWNQQW